MKFVKSLLFATLVLAASNSVAAEAADNSMKFGAAVPVSGRIAFVGENLLKGAELTVANINAAGGVLGKPVTLVTADTKGSAQDAIAAVTKLIEVDKVNALLGPTSATVMSVIKRVQDSGIPASFIGSTSALDDTIKGKTTFRFSHSDTQFGPAMALLAIDRGFKQCAIVVDSLENAQTRKTAIVSAFKKLGGDIVKTIDLAPNQTSYRSELLDLFKAPLPQCVFFQMSPDIAAQFWQNAGEFAEISKVTFVASDFGISAGAIKAMAPVADRASVIALSLASVGPGRDVFQQAYLKHFPNEKQPVLYSDLMWDSMTVLALAAEKAGSLDPAAIAANVRNVANPPGTVCSSFADCKKLLNAGQKINYEGAVGSCDVDEKGNSHSGYAIYKVTTEAEKTGELPESRVAALLDQLKQ